MPYSRKPLICKIDDLPRVLKMILAHQLLYATKPRDDDWSKKKWSWREFFSELVEPPIHPHLIQVVPPFLEESNPVYMIQMSCEVAWKCREFTVCLIEYLIYSKRASCLSARSLMNPPAKEKGELKACEMQTKRTRTGTNQPKAQTRGVDRGHVSCSLLLAASCVTFISFRRNKCQSDLQTS